MDQNQFEESFGKQVAEGTNQLIDNIKLILYKRDNTIFESIQFDKDEIYSDPFLFAGISSTSKMDLTTLLWGYQNAEKQKNPLTIVTDQNGLIYIPNIGYFITNQINEEIQVVSGDVYTIWKNDLPIDFKFESPLKIHDHFELLAHPLNLLNECFQDESGNDIPIEITEITKKHFTNLQKALDKIRTHAPKRYELIKKTTSRMVIFNDVSMRRNSFAIHSVHGCGFFNAYEEDYNEVFFIEDVAHQCGHVIFNAYLATKPEIFRADKELKIVLENSNYRPRSLYVVVHAMYTYESIFTCFDGCLSGNNFSGNKLHELFGRLAYTILKFNLDYTLLTSTDEEANNLYLTEEGIQLINGLKETYDHIMEKWGKCVSAFNLNNQPYIFSYINFLKLNPLLEYEII